MPSSNARPAMVTRRAPATPASTVQVIRLVLDERPAAGRRSPLGAAHGSAVLRAAPAVAALLAPGGRPLRYRLGPLPRIMLSRGGATHVPGLRAPRRVALLHHQP